MYTVTLDDIKKYLVISVSTYDANITSILGIWNPTVDEMIDSNYVDDSSLENTLKAGKLLFISAKLRDILPRDCIGRISERVEETQGDRKVVIDNRSDKQEIREDALELLRPYLKQDILITSSTEDVTAEFNAVDNGW